MSKDDIDGYDAWTVVIMTVVVTCLCATECGSSNYRSEHGHTGDEITQQLVESGGDYE